MRKYREERAKPQHCESEHEVVWSDEVQYIGLEQYIGLGLGKLNRVRVRVSCS